MVGDCLILLACTDSYPDLVQLLASHCLKLEVAFGVYNIVEIYSPLICRGKANGAQECRWFNLGRFVFLHVKAANTDGVRRFRKSHIRKNKTRASEFFPLPNCGVVKYVCSPVSDGSC